MCFIICSSLKNVKWELKFENFKGRIVLNRVYILCFVWCYSWRIYKSEMLNFSFSNGIVYFFKWVFRGIFICNYYINV